MADRILRFYNSIIQITAASDESVNILKEVLLCCENGQLFTLSE